MAATYIWSGGGTDDDWNTATNWSGNVAAVSKSDTVLRFAGQTRLTPTTASAFLLRSITFDAGSEAFTLGGASLTMGNGSSITNNSTSLQTIANAGIALSGDSTWNSGTGGLAVSSVLSGSGWLYKNGTGTLSLSGANTYGGSISIAAGTLSAAHDSALGAASGAVILSNGATLNLNNADIIKNEVRVRGTGVGGQGALTATGTSSITGLLTFDASTTIGGTGTLTVDEMKEISSGTTVTKVGGGTLIIAGTGLVRRTEFVINEGLVILDKTNTYALSGDHLTVNNGGRIQLAGTGNDQINNSTRLILNTGGVLDTNGRSEIVASLEGGGSVTNTATGGSSLLVVGGPEYNPSSTFSGVLDDGAGTLSLEKRGTGTLTLGGANTYTGGTTIADGILLVTGSLGDGDYAGDIANSATLAFDSATHQTLAGVLSGPGALTKSGVGTLTLSGQNNYTGPTTIHAGAFRVNGSLGATTVTIAAGATLTGAGTIGGPATIAGDAHLAPGNSPGTLTFTNGLDLQDGAILDIELGTTSDLVRVSGGVLSSPASGTITVNLSAAGGFAAGIYTLIDATGADLASIGATSFALGTTIAGHTYTFSQNGNRFLLTVGAIPEPGAAALLTGITILAASLRRRRHPALSRV